MLTSISMLGKGYLGGDETTKLLCAWHVDRAWRTALLHHIDTKQSRIVVYHQLRILLMDNQEASFRQLLQQFISFLDANEERFSKYFKENYCNRLCEWASCFRRGSVVNTNMFVESFHRTLKVVYLEHKQNRRIDVLLHMLLKLSRDLYPVRCIARSGWPKKRPLHFIGLRVFARAVSPPYVRSWFWLGTSKAQTHLIRHTNYLQP